MIKKSTIKEYLLITVSTVMIILGTYLFKFPNNFAFGGVSGLAIVLGKITPLTPATMNLILNVVLVIIGFIFLGKKFGIKTTYSSLLFSVGISALQYIHPITKPLTDQPMLELVFATILPSAGVAILFNIGASNGGTNVVAMILEDRTRLNIGKALFISDVLITVAAFFIFDIKTVLYSVLGLMAKSLVVDNVIENINLCKYFNVVCKDPDPICDFIVNKLKRSATICQAKGAFTQEDKYIVFTVLKNYQALQLRQFIKFNDPKAFILITNTSEIIGKGFHGS